MGPFAIRPGTRYPGGATLTAAGVNFSMFSRPTSRAWSGGSMSVPTWSRARARDPADDGGSAFRALVSDPGFDWGDAPSAARGLKNFRGYSTRF